MHASLVEVLKARITDTLNHSTTKEQYKNRLAYMQAVLNEDIKYLKLLAPKRKQDYQAVQKVQTHNKSIQTMAVNSDEETQKAPTVTKKSKQDKRYSDEPYNDVSNLKTDISRQKKLTAAERAADREYRANKQMTIQTAESMRNQNDQNTINVQSEKSIQDQINEVQNALTERQQQKSDQKADSQSPEAPERKNKVLQVLQNEGVLISSADLKDYNLSKIHGMTEMKKTIQECILVPKLFPSLVQNLQVHNRFLLHSLPGCGKSFFVKCIAGECQYNLVQVAPSVIFSKYQGQSEKLIKGVFEMAMTNQPCILFLDEIDSICGERNGSESESSRRVKNEILLQMDSLLGQKQILLIGATNLPMEIDSAVRRRFEKRIYVDLPDDDARRAMFETWIQIDFRDQREDIIKHLTEITKDYSGADITNISKTINFLPMKKLTGAKYFFLNESSKYEICDKDHTGAIQTTLMNLAGQDIQPPLISRDDVIDTVSKIRSSVRREDIKQHKAFSEQYGSE